MSTLEQAARQALEALRDLVVDSCRRDECDIPAIAALEQALQRQAQVQPEWPVMGFGNVAIGGGKDNVNGMPCLIYLKLDGPRAINADTTDVFPVGQVVPQEKLLACVYFKDGSAMQQTIEVLQEMQAEAGYTHPQPAAQYDQQALELCEKCGWKTLIPTEGCLNCERKPAAPAIPPQWIAVLKEARAVAMQQTGEARIPECGHFGEIAQDLDWLLSQMLAAAPAQEGGEA